MEVLRTRSKRLSSWAWSSAWKSASLVSNKMVVDPAKKLSGWVQSTSAYNTAISKLGAGTHQYVTQLVTKWDYVCEEHPVHTPDGWTLIMQRIPCRRRAQSSDDSKGVVFFLHSFLASSASAMLNGPDESLPFILADAGYDVWLGNSRGNGISMEAAGEQPWAFSFDQMAEFDLPSQIARVLEVSGAKQITFIGHGQGAAQGFAAFQNEELASKINLFVALAPSVYMSHTSSTLFNALGRLKFNTWLSRIGLPEFSLTSSALLERGFPELINHLPALNLGLVDFVAGQMKDVDPSKKAYYSNYLPCPTSMRNLLQWSQMACSGRFQKYDFGAQSNVQTYGQAEPPRYSITRLPDTLPVLVFSGQDDQLVSSVDVQRLLRELPNLVDHIAVPTFGHFDFVLSGQASVAVYSRILNALANLATFKAESSVDARRSRSSERPDSKEVTSKPEVSESNSEDTRRSSASMASSGSADSEVAAIKSEDQQQQQQPQQQRPEGHKNKSRSGSQTSRQTHVLALSDISMPTIFGNELHNSSPVAFHKTGSPSQQPSLGSSVEAPPVFLRAAQPLPGPIASKVAPQADKDIVVIGKVDAVVEHIEHPDDISTDREQTSPVSSAVAPGGQSEGEASRDASSSESQADSNGHETPFVHPLRESSYKAPPFVPQFPIVPDLAAKFTEGEHKAVLTASDVQPLHDSAYRAPEFHAQFPIVSDVVAKIEHGELEPSGDDATSEAEAHRLRASAPAFEPAAESHHLRASAPAFEPSVSKPFVTMEGLPWPLSNAP